MVWPFKKMGFSSRDSLHGHAKDILLDTVLAQFEHIVNSSICMC